MKNFIFFRGLKRSGNHLVINWMLSLFKDTFFYNDINPFPNFNLNYVTEKIKTIKNCETLIISTEIPHIMSKTDYATIISFCFNHFRPERMFSPFLIRDAFNWYSSQLLRIIKTEKRPIDKEQILFEAGKSSNELWDSYRKSLIEWQNCDFKINYNSFVTNINHRKEICAKLGVVLDLNKDKEIMNLVWKHPSINFPSSFDENIPAKDMKVFERYKEIKYVFDQFPVPQGILEEHIKIWKFPIKKIKWL